MKQHETAKVKIEKVKNIYLIGKLLFGMMGDAFRNVSFI